MSRMSHLDTLHSPKHDKLSGGIHFLFGLAFRALSKVDTTFPVNGLLRYLSYIISGENREIAGLPCANGRKVRAPMDRVVGNAHRSQEQGKCHRKHTAGQPVHPATARVK